MYCAGNPSLTCDNVAREVHSKMPSTMCMDMPSRVCRNITHWETKQECDTVRVERCGTVDQVVETPVEEEVCRDTTVQECVDVTRNIVISVPREITKQKCVNITVTKCNDVEVQVPERKCHAQRTKIYLYNCKP